MSKIDMKEIIHSLKPEQLQLLYDRISNQGTEHAVDKSSVPTQQYDIAIIGLSGKYPQSKDHYDFWEKIKREKNFIKEVPDERWDHIQYYDPEIGKSFVPNKTRCKFGAFLNQYDNFDCSFFDLDPDILLAVDPQERFALETTWSCIEDAGYTPEKVGRDVGVFSGMTGSEYQKMVPISTHSYTLNNRITYFFDFKGPSLTTDAGCCSSLASIHLACQSLMREECKTAIVIGTNMILHPDHYSGSSPMLSSSTKPCSNPFGVDDGWIPAEGIVSILLKPLNKAVADKDHIYAVIKSSHICQEGKTSWFGASNPKQQARVIVDNFKKSGISPETISYVEAAANGSSLGDAIELDGLTTAFSCFTDKKRFCSIGTVKSNVGHAEGVSTLVQLTKVLLQFKSKTLFPIINLEKTNPNIDIENSPFYFQKSAQKWEPMIVKVNGEAFEIPRRATISSFGTGGNSGHLILEEHVQSAVENEMFNNYYIPLSSKTPHQLKQTVKDFIKFFDEYVEIDVEKEKNYTLSNIMFTLCTGRVNFRERVVFIADSMEAMMKLFHKFLNEENDNNIILKGQHEKVNAVNIYEIEKHMADHLWREIACLWVSGKEVPWEGFYKSRSCHRVPLPTYSFDKQHYPIAKPICTKPIEQDYIKQDQFDKYKVDRKVEPNSPILNSVEKNDCASFENDVNVINIFTEIFSEMLDIDQSQIDIFIPMDKYGFNSAMVICVANKLKGYFSHVPKTLFFECQTIKDLIDYFAKNYPDEVIGIQWKKENVENTKVVLKKEEYFNQISTQHKVEDSEDIDLVSQLAKAILSDTMTAEMLLKKL